MDRILLIDDERDVADSIEKILSRFGYLVIVARNGEEGIRLFDEYPGFDCVVTGISMPKANGNEVAKHVRASGKRDTPVVAITGCVEEAIERELFNLSLIKPFRIKSLISAIKSLAAETALESPECQIPQRKC
jgi:DNA-binding response OmpR family regulator